MNKIEIQGNILMSSTTETFSYIYKKNKINVTTNYQVVNPKYDNLKRYHITINVNDSYIVNIYEDFNTMKCAVNYSLEQCFLLHS